MEPFIFSKKKMKARKIIGHKIICDSRSCYPQREGCHSEIHFDEKEIIWDYANLPDRALKLKDAFPSLYNIDVKNLSKENITGIEFGYIYCPVCGEKLFYGTRELILPLIEELLDAHIPDIPENALKEAVDYYKGNLYTPLKDLLEKDDVKRGRREASAFVSYTYGPLEDV